MVKKKRIVFISILLVIILLIISAVILFLYFYTDMFKSDEMLFFKYLGENMKNVNIIEKRFDSTEYEQMLETNKYTESTEIKVNYTENIGTTSENTNNVINKLKLKINGQVDKTNQYDYKKVELQKENKTLLGINYVQNNNFYGIKFLDLFEQYIFVEDNNLKDLIKKFGYTEESENIPDNINLNNNILQEIRFSEEEKEILKNRYLTIIDENVSKEDVKKQANQTITINQKDIITDSYILSLTKEEMNNIYIKILEKLKEDNIILEKLDKIFSVNSLNIKEQFIEEIDSTIQEISKTNIGNDETKIIVYEYDGKTVRTMVQGVDYEISIDFFSENEEGFAEIKVTEKEKNKKYTLKYDKDKISLVVKNEEGEEPNNFSFTQNTKVNNKNCVKNIVLKYEDSDNKVEMAIEQNLDIVESFSEEIDFNQLNKVVLNEMEEEQLKQMVSKIGEGLSQKIELIEQDVKIEEIKEVLKAVGILKEEINFNEVEVSNIEKNRFNSKFEMLKGENIDGEDMIKTIEAIQENLIDMKAVSNHELKLEISRGENNQELIEILKNFMEKNKDKKYNINIEYDDIGFVKYILLTMLEE